MFPLFELSRLLHFANDAQKTEQTVTVRQYAWKEVGERSFLALLFSNGYFLFRHATHGRVPICRQLPWYTDRTIQSMAFDPSATWLLCTSTKDVLYLVPALPLLDNRVQVSQPWKTDDITKIKYRKKRGLPICLTWWHTLNDEDIAVIGTKLGFVVFVDLRAEKVIIDSDVNEQVSNIELLQNDEHTATHALVTTKSNSQWKILLETSHGVKGSIFSDSVEALGYESVDQSSFNISILHDSETNGTKFQPVKCQQFSTATFVTPLHIKSQNLVAARDLHKKLFEIYDTSMDRSPLYVYTIPETVNDVIMTDRLIFFTSTEESSCLEVVARQLSEASGLEHRQEFNQEAVLQKFRLRPEERIITAFKRTYPFYWHEKLEEENSNKSSELSSGFTNKRSSSPFRISSHTVLDGCIILTTQNIYECRPRVSPEALFVDLAVARSDHSSAETLAIALGLDVNALYYLAAQLHLSRHDYNQAARFFQLAKCPHLQRVGAFAQYGCMSEVLRYLQQTLSCHLHELKRNEGYGLSNMAVLAFIQQLLEDKSRTNELIHQLGEFLANNTLYDSKEAAELLITHGFFDLALEMGKARNCIPDILMQIHATGGSTEKSTSAIIRDVPHDQVQKLLFSPFIDHLNPADLVYMLQEYRSTTVSFLTHFQAVLYDLDADTLLNVSRLLDISHPVYRKVINLSTERPRRSRYESTSSVDSALNENTCNSDIQGERVGILRKLVETFIKCVILLNHHRGSGELQLSFTADEFSPPYQMCDQREKPTLQYHLEPRHQILSAGKNDSAMVHKGKLYVWGEAFEEERTEEAEDKGSLQLWHTFCPRGLRSCFVTAVACGAHHSLANTNLGIYAWGDNRYGQLGVGVMGDGTFCGPQKVCGLGDAFCVDIACGHYHSLLLTDDCRVYSWGWGVHGQLGLGDVTDRARPEIVKLSLDHRVCDIAAGYAHSLLCTVTGDVYACGSGIFGQLGLGTTSKHSLPKQIKDLKDFVCSVATKDFHCLALTSGGEIYQWGASPNQLCFMVKDQRQARMRGYPTPTPDQPERHLSPRLVNIACVGAKIVKIGCGGNFSALLTEDGEVFTWGKNYDGQLGIGNRNEQKIPVIVNRINDRKVVAIACGGDHMVAMDTEWQVWSWGRNDFGQLAVVTSQGPCPSGGGQGIYVSMGISAAVWPVKVPALNKITTAGSPASFSYRPVVETAGKWVKVLPKLHPYTCDTLFTVLRHLPADCDPALWLQLCLNYKLPVTAGSLALLQGALPLALHCHLQALTSNKVADIKTKTQRLGLIAEFYFRKLDEEEDTYDSAHIQKVQAVICQLAEVWNKEGCDVNSFTQVISRHLPTMAWTVFLLLMRSPNCHSSDSSTDNEITQEDFVDYSPPQQLPAPLVTKLTAPFCLEVTSCVVQLIQEDKIPRAQVSLLYPNVNVSSELAEERRLISTEKLWDEIFQNLRKDSASQSEILLSQNDLDSLVTLTAKDPKVTKGDVGNEGDAVVFSCGHHLSRRALLEEIVPEIEQILVSMSLPQSALFFGSHFRQQGTIRTACPHCVLMSIRNS